MRFFFTLASAVYIVAIFLWADSSVVSQLSAFNPYSLLHIPLYGILTALLILSFPPLKLRKNVIHDANDRNVPNDQTDNAITQNRKNPMNPANYFVVGLVALIVAIADEVHQYFIPFRDASIIDVFLDLVGISLVLILLSKYNKKSQKINHLITKWLNNSITQWPNDLVT